MTCAAASVTEIILVVGFRPAVCGEESHKFIACCLFFRLTSSIPALMLRETLLCTFTLLAVMVIM